VAEATSQQTVTVVIPAYNEAPAIASVVADVARALASAGICGEVLVVDDGSRDGTADLAMAAGARVIRHPTNLGYGAALRTGIRAAGSEIIATTDADGTYPVECLPALVEEASRFDLVIGARTGPEYRGKRLKGPARDLYLWLVRYVTGVNVPDANSGLRVFRREAVLRHLDTYCLGFSFTTTMTLVMLLNGYFVGFVPIDYRQRIGQSRVRIFRDSLRTAQIITSAVMRYNPIKVFLPLAAAPAAAAVALLGAAVWTAQAWLITPIVICLVGAVLVFGLGLLADLVSQMQGRRLG
jgi:glycosyltransferase involved in cell wall biosynthesis